MDVDPLPAAAAAAPPPPAPPPPAAAQDGAVPAGEDATGDLRRKFPLAVDLSPLVALMKDVHAAKTEDYWT